MLLCNEGIWAAMVARLRRLVSMIDSKENLTGRLGDLLLIPRRLLGLLASEV